MVDGMVKRNFLNDDIFKADYYDEYGAAIKSNVEYQRMESIANAMGLRIIFGFSNKENWFTTQYEIGFEICDAEGKLIAVSKTSRFYDHLFNLISYFPIVSYQKLKKKLIVFAIDDEELCNDCKLFFDYLTEEQNLMTGDGSLS